jgi:hypothetical protein
LRLEADKIERHDVVLCYISRYDYGSWSRLGGEAAVVDGVIAGDESRVDGLQQLADGGVLMIAGEGCMQVEPGAFDPVVGGAGGRQEAQADTSVLGGRRSLHGPTRMDAIARIILYALVEERQQEAPAGYSELSHT